ncbi:MAG: SDR family oxidoreductase [Acidobacteria bacterium]|nr:SDR family oxidoreductase [Acidobacteriota bacterium]
MSRTVIITGGTRGLGAVIAQEFLTAGDHVAALARHTPTGQSDSDSCAFFQADVTSAGELKNARDAVIARWGKLDVWINNAGYGRVIPFLDGDDGEWARMIDVNFWGVVHGSRIAIDAMRQDGGAIINIASLAGLMAPRQHSAYAVSKAAVIALTRSLAVEFAEQRIRVNAIAPGPLDTEGFRAAGGDPQLRAATIPNRQMTQPSEVARACLFLAEPLNSLTGTTLLLDGGSSAAGCYV